MSITQSKHLNTKHIDSVSCTVLPRAMLYCMIYIKQCIVHSVTDSNAVLHDHKAS